MPTASSTAGEIVDLAIQSYAKRVVDFITSWHSLRTTYLCPVVTSWSSPLGGNGQHERFAGYDLKKLRQAAGGSDATATLDFRLPLDNWLRIDDLVIHADAHLSKVRY